MIHSIGEGSYSCCGITLPSCEAEPTDGEHEIRVEKVEDEYFVSLSHPMTKKHYISFLAYVTSDRIQFVKLYPEQNAETRFRICETGNIYAYCNRHGLFKITSDIKR